MFIITGVSQTRTITARTWDSDTPSASLVLQLLSSSILIWPPDSKEGNTNQIHGQQIDTKQTPTPTQLVRMGSPTHLQDSLQTQIPQ